VCHCILSSSEPIMGQPRLPHPCADPVPSANILKQLSCRLCLLLPLLLTEARPSPFLCGTPLAHHPSPCHPRYVLAFHENFQSSGLESMIGYPCYNQYMYQASGKGLPSRAQRNTIMGHPVLFVLLLLLLLLYCRGPPPSSTPPPTSWHTQQPEASCASQAWVKGWGSSGLGPCNHRCALLYPTITAHHGCHAPCLCPCTHYHWHAFTGVRGVYMGSSCLWQAYLDGRPF
jgi:hypothetical protein